MKKLMTVVGMLVAVFAILPAFAFEVSVTTNATPTMLAPPARTYVGTSLYALKKRATTNEYVAAGEVWREGLTPIVAANSGYVTNGFTTVTNVVGATTNIVRRILPLTLPVNGGLSDADGTVHWFVVPQARSSLLIQPYITAGGTVTFSADDGTFTEATSLTKTILQGFTGALYGKASVTNCSVNVLPW